MLRAFVVGLVALVVTAQPVHARIGDDGPGDARVTGVCSGGAVAELRLKAEDDGIELRFRIARSRAGASWRVALVHERRVVWKGTVRTGRRSRSLELRRTLRDLPGDDTVTARAWGPRGATCRATARLAEA